MPSRTSASRSNSSSDDAASSSSGSENNLVLNINHEKNLSSVESSASVDAKPKVKKDEGAAPSSATAVTPVVGATKEEEKMEVDDESKELKLKVSFTPNMSSVAAKTEADPFTPSVADFGVVNVPGEVTVAPPTVKRGRYV